MSPRWSLQYWQFLRYLTLKDRNWTPLTIFFFWLAISFLNWETIPCRQRCWAQKWSVWFWTLNLPFQYWSNPSWEADWWRLRVFCWRRSWGWHHRMERFSWSCSMNHCIVSNFIVLSPRREFGKAWREEHALCTLNFSRSSDTCCTSF